MHLWILGNTELTTQLLAGRSARAEAVSRAGYRGITAVERAVRTVVEALASGLRGLGQRLALAHRRRRAIAELRRMDDRLLKDIGVSRGEIVDLVDGTLDRGPMSVAELRHLRRPRPSAQRPVPGEALPQPLSKAA